ncbi:mycorrhiza-induced NACHT/WD-repeat protein [Flagelloscypha sp. PMI_526]|nr:mycorrhiza-induced NACHT/WD-repeat protein [Flagelloscypha sp. PMI_526]
MGGVQKPKHQFPSNVEVLQSSFLIPDAIYQQFLHDETSCFLLTYTLAVATMSTLGDFATSLQCESNEHVAPAPNPAMRSFDREVNVPVVSHSHSQINQNSHIHTGQGGDGTRGGKGGRGGDFYSHNTTNNFHGQEFALRDNLEVSREAPFNSDAAQKLGRRECTPNTRVKILREIISWAKDNNHPMLSSLFWIFGLAGTGKSTIAQSVCEMLEKDGLLASSYFCSVQLDSRNSKRIVPTIAYNLAARFPIFEKFLVSKLRHDPGCAYSRISSQFRDQLCGPWGLFMKKAAPQKPCVVIIDALDECDEGNEVLRLILGAIDHDELPGIRFLVTSRPVDALMKKALKMSRGPQIALHEVKKEEVSDDIRLFLEEQLHEKVEPSIIQKLTAQADGLFIYASTLAKHLVPNSDFATQVDIQERLEQILKPRHQGGVIGLYDLYDRILCDVLSPEKFGPEGLKQRLIILQTLVSMEEATTAHVISDFLGYNVEDVVGIVNGLHSVLFTRGSGEPIYVIHASFHEFVVSQAQGPLTCDPSSIHNRMAQSCLLWMQANLKFNICNIESSFTTNDDLPVPLNSIGKSLAYACQHWWTHVTRCTKEGQEGIKQKIGEMMEKKGLFWIEVMTLLGDEGRCQNILTGIAETSWIGLEPAAKQNGWKLQSLAREAADMVSTFRKITPKMTSHLYLSILSSREGKHLEPWTSQFWRLPHVLSRKVDGSRNMKLIMNVESLVCVRIWDAESGKQVGKFDGHEDSVLSVAVSPDGKHVVSGSSDNTVRIWDAESGEQVGQLDGHGDSVSSVAFSPDGKRVFSGSHDKSVRIWDAESGKQVSYLDGHGSLLLSIAFTPDGKRVVSGSSDNSVRIWDAESGEQIGKLDGHSSLVLSVAFSPDGKRAVSGSSDNSVRIWDVESGKQVGQLDGHGDSVSSVSFSPDGKRIASGSHDNSVRIWDAKSGKQVGKLNGHADSVSSVAFSPDGKCVVSGSSDSSVRIWDADSGEHVGQLDGHESPVWSVAFSPDGKRVVSGSSDSSVRIWDAESGEQVGKLDGHGSMVWSVAFSPDGKRVVSGSHDNSVRIWDAEFGKQVCKLDGHGSSVSSVSFSPDGKRVVSGSSDISVRIWDARSGKQVSYLDGHGDSVSSVAFSPDGKRVVSGSSDNSVRIWDAKSGKQVGQLDGHGDSVLSVAFSPDGKRVASGSHDNSVRIWDAESGKQVGQLDGHGDSVSSVSFSPDGKRIASGSHDNSVRIWDARSSEQISQLDGQGTLVWSVAFSPDGKRVVSGSHDNSVRIWDAESGKRVGRLEGHSESASSVTFSPMINDNHRFHKNKNTINLSIKPRIASTPLEFCPTSITIQSYSLRLSPTSASHYTREDGWIVTSKEYTEVEHKLLWLPPSLRPFHPLLLMELSEFGFNRIDLSSCTFGKGWFNIYCPNPHWYDSSTHARRRVVDSKERELRDEHHGMPQAAEYSHGTEPVEYISGFSENTVKYPHSDSLKQRMTRLRGGLKEIFSWTN